MGILPVYWKALEHLSGFLRNFVHRIIWSLVVLVGFLGLDAHWDGCVVRAEPRLLLPWCLLPRFVTVNWLTLSLANNTGHIVEASLGYFINPLVNVLAGRAVPP